MKNFSSFGGVFMAWFCETGEGLMRKCTVATSSFDENDGSENFCVAGILE